MAAHTLPLLALLLVAALAPAAAHYNLKSPMPYNPIDCNRPKCAGPCPPIWKHGRARARNTPSHPSAVWRRGQKVPIEWHRNNHEGGYYRRSLVPVRHMFNAAWHKKTAFEWGCYTQNRYKCGRKASCGTDKDGYAYRNSMRVPEVFPDGDYVFAMVWFGGLHWRRNRALFSDYYTCAYVRIRGGPLMRTHRPRFVPGKNHRKVRPGTCASTSAFARQCGGEPCDGHKVREDVAGVFRNGRKPPPVLLRDLDKNALATVPDHKLTISSDAEEKRAEKQSDAEARRDAQWAKEEQKARSASRRQRRTRRKPTPKVSKKPWRAPAKQQPWKKPHNRQVKKQPWRAPKKTQKQQRKKPWRAPKKTHKQPWRAPKKQTKRGRCANMHKAPQPPTGGWGPKDSWQYNRKRLQWWSWRNYCKPRRICTCWPGRKA
eukprot:IDg9168t1